ncbi:MAG: sulfur oxidation c-type cytochrome SoxX [bacterium]
MKASLVGIACLSTLLFSANVVIADDDMQARIDKGKELAFNRKKGNCLTCHRIEGGSLVGNAGPPLIQMSHRYPTKKALRAQIYDSTVRNPMTIMPPFGRHEILTPKELDLVTDFIYSL